MKCRVRKVREEAGIVGTVDAHVVSECWFKAWLLLSGAPGKALEGGPGLWVPSVHLGDQMSISFLPQPELKPCPLWPFGK